MNYALGANLDAPVTSTDRIVIIGDSGATGAMTDPNFTLAGKDMADRLGKLIFRQKPDLQPKASDFSNPEKFKLRDPLDPPNRIFFSAEESEGQQKEFLEFQAQATRQVDVGQFSWGYMVGRALDVQPSNIIIAAKDGATLGTMDDQLDRVKTVTGNTLPSVVFVSFTSNDLCHEDLLQKSIEEIAEDYSDTMADQIQYAVKNFSPAADSGTTIFWMAPLPVADVLTSNEILQKHVPFVDQNVSCRDLREGNLEKAIGDFNIGELFAKFCPSVQNTKPSDQNRVQKISEIFNAITETQKRVIDRLSSSLPKGYRVQYIEATRALKPTGEDIANDCFHPSLRGHEKVASAVMSVLTRQSSQK